MLGGSEGSVAAEADPMIVRRQQRAIALRLLVEGEGIVLLNWVFIPLKK